MKLEQMYPNFLIMSEAEKVSFVAGYRQKRNLDLNSIPEKEKSVRSKIDVTEEERAVLKMLGISLGDVKSLRGQESFESPEETAALFEDNTFAEGEEESA
jgi:hypothetical protein